MKSIALDWLQQANDDLKAASNLLSGIASTNLVAIHSRQCVEKCFKALAESHSREITDTNNLIHLAKFIKPFPMEIDMELLARLNGFYSDFGNSLEMKLLVESLPTRDEAVRFRDFAEEVLKISLGICKDENDWDSSTWNFLPFFY